MKPWIHTHEHGALRKRSITGAPTTSGPMMTPMVDVVLVILIFFMGSATIAGHEWFLGASIEDNDPEPSPAAPTLGLPTPIIETRVVMLGTTPHVLGLGPDPITLDEARSVISSMDMDDPDTIVVTISADDDAPMGDVVDLHDSWNALGVRVRLE